MHFGLWANCGHLDGWTAQVDTEAVERDHRQTEVPPTP